MIMFSRFFGKRPSRAKGQWLYEHALAASRNVEFYGQGKVPDTVDGRFDLLTIHVWLLIRHLNAVKAQDLGQEVFDAMFDDMDNALRELGTSDTSVGKRIKDMAKVFYDRAEQYNAALDAADVLALAGALKCNLYEGSASSEPFCAGLAAYMQGIEKVLAEQAMPDLLKSGPCYPSFA